MTITMEQILRQSEEFEKEWTASKTIAVKTEEEAKKKEYKVPMPTHPKVMNDNNVDYRMLGIVTANSKNKEGEAHNNIMKNDIDFEKIAKDFGLAVGTVRKIFNKLKKAESNVLEAVNTSEGVAYKINYQTDGKYYTTVNHNILRVLSNTTNDKVIKCYLVLCYELKNGSKQITKQWLAEKIGYSINGNNYDKAMTDILAVLGSLKLINMTLEPHTVYNKTIGREVETHIYRFSLNSYEEFKTNYEKTTKQKLK